MSTVRNHSEQLNNYVTKMNVNPTDIESFIKLKKACEAGTNGKDEAERQFNDIIDLSNIVTNDKDMKLSDLDDKEIIEDKDISVKFTRKLDATTYLIENNIQKFRQELKTKISKFDEEVKVLQADLNKDEINKYSDQSIDALTCLDNFSISIKQKIMQRDQYKQLEDDLEFEPNLKSNFTNLDNVEYDYHLKMDLWSSVKEFQDTKLRWNDEAIFYIDIKNMQEKLEKWEYICKVGKVDLELSEVPDALMNELKIYKNMIPILTAVQNPNINQDKNFTLDIITLLGIEKKLDDKTYFLQILLDGNLEGKIEDFIKLKEKENEEKKLKDEVAKIYSEYKPRQIPIPNTDDFYDKRIFQKEADFVEEKLYQTHQLFLNPYSAIVERDLMKIDTDLERYYEFINLYTQFQFLLFKKEGMMNNQEFQKEFNTEHKKLLCENQRKSLKKYLKESYNSIGKLVTDNGFEKIKNMINNIIKDIEENYKAITEFLENKRKSYPKYYLLDLNELNIIYMSKEVAMPIIEQYTKKLFPWIETISFGTVGDENVLIRTIDKETRPATTFIKKQITPTLLACVLPPIVAIIVVATSL